MGTINSLCTLFLQCKKAYHSYYLPTHTCNIHNLHTKTTHIKSKSLSMHITTKTHFVQITVHTSHDIINNSARITSETHFFTIHPLVFYALTSVNSINVRYGVFFLHTYFSFMVQREHASISLSNRGNTRFYNFFHSPLRVPG